MPYMYKVRVEFIRLRVFGYSKLCTSKHLKFFPWKLRIFFVTMINILFWILRDHYRHLNIKNSLLAIITSSSRMKDDRAQSVLNEHKVFWKIYLKKESAQEYG